MSAYYCPVCTKLITNSHDHGFMCPRWGNSVTFQFLQKYRF